MNCNKIFALLLFFSSHLLLGQVSYEVTVDAAQLEGPIVPLWNDYWEIHTIHGYGLNPAYPFNPPHVPFCEDEGFVPSMELVQPRSIKMSIGAWTILPELDYASLDTNVLKTLATEYYRGPNTIEGAQDPDHYYFGYLDKQLDAIEKIGAEPFFNIDYMPYTLAKNQIPKLFVNPLFGHFFQYDNEIRTSPPADYHVFAEVVKHVILHTKGLFKGDKDYNITYFELWNEPDHQLATDVLPNFWGGTEYELFETYQAIANAIEEEPLLSDEIKLGCCSFAILNETEEIFAENFLKEIEDKNTRLDFLSIHPYLNAEFSLDTNKLNLAQWAIDTYSPEAELINAEWGVLDPASNEFTEILEHDLRNLKDIIWMMDHNITFAHFVSLIEGEPNPNQASLGVCYTDPISLKITGQMRSELNRLMDQSPIKIKTTTDANGAALAGWGKDESILNVFVAGYRPEEPGISNQISISINNLPFDDFEVSIYKLTESSFENGTQLTLVESFLHSGSNFSDTVSYEIDQESGALFLWHLDSPSLSSKNWPIINDEFRIENHRDFFRIVAPTNLFSQTSYQLIDLQGRQLQSGESQFLNGQMDLTFKNINPGFYLLNLALDDQNFCLQIIK